MSSASSVLAINNDFPIKTDQPVHSGKVRSVYWLTEQDSARLIAEKNYPVPANTPLAIMIISDRISAFDCVWHAEGGLQGVPGKGAALNSIANHWFKLFKQNGLADSHILDIPHPFVWIVQKAKPVMIEAICRQYITGSMWRAYENGERNFCGNQLPENLNKDQRLDDTIITPSSKGILHNIPGVPAVDDVNISRQDIEKNYAAFNFNSSKDIDLYEQLLKQGFALISRQLADIGQIFVDTKFEFGYVKDAQGNDKLIYMDEVGTPDSSRMWDASEYSRNHIIENSKEGFRQLLLSYFPDPDILLNKDRMQERQKLAADNALPQSVLMQVSQTYIALAEKITGQKISISDNPKQQIIDILDRDYQLIK